MCIHKHRHTKSWEYNSVVKWEVYHLQRSVFNPQNRINTHTQPKITFRIQVGDVTPFAVSLSSIYKALDLTPFPHKPVVGIHICNPSIQEVMAEISVPQSHPWLHDEFKANLDYMTTCLKKQTKEV